MSDATIAMQAAKQLPGVNKGGRPDKIGAWHVNRAKTYIDGAWQDDGSIIPTVEGMAEYIDISREQCYRAEELSHMLSLCQRLQAKMVINKSLANEYNPAISKLLLSAKHGYVERTEVANTHEVVAPQQVEVAQDFQAYVNSKTLTDGTKAQD